MKGLLHTLFTPRPLQGRTEIVRGIECQIQIVPASSEDAGTYVVQVNAPQGNCNIVFTAVRRNIKSWLASLFLGRAKITTGDSALDRRVYLYSEPSSTSVVADYFAAPKNRAAVQTLIELGCERVVMNAMGASAVWTVPATTARSPEPETVQDAVPILAVLAGRRPQDLAGGARSFPAQEQIERLEEIANVKSWEITALLAVFPWIAPAAYFYVGGWRYGLVAAAVIIPFLYGLIQLPSPWAEAAAPVFFFIPVLKAYEACLLRNRLVNEEAQISALDFNSFRYGGFAMTDFFLGCGMMLAAGLCWVFGVKSVSDTGALVQYLIIAPPVVWLVELGVGFVLLRASWKITGAVNPFLEQQGARWQPKDDATTSAQSPGTPFLPTLREALWAIMLTVVAPAVIEFVRIAASF